MCVTAIHQETRRKSRLVVYLDGVVAGDISRRAAKEHGLRPGVKLTTEQFEAIALDDQKRIALDASVAMLARRPRSERDIRTRLRRRRLNEDVVESTVERLRSAGLIDDAEYARSFADVRARTSPRSKRLIVQELRSAGVAQELGVAAVEEQDDAEVAYTLAKSKMRSVDQAEWERLRAKLSGLLQRRGFSWAVTRTAIDRCWRELESGREDAA